MQRMYVGNQVGTVHTNKNKQKGSEINNVLVLTHILDYGRLLRTTTDTPHHYANL